MCSVNANPKSRWLSLVLFSEVINAFRQLSCQVQLHVPPTPSWRNKILFYVCQSVCDITLKSFGFDEVMAECFDNRWFINCQWNDCQSLPQRPFKGLIKSSLLDIYWHLIFGKLPICYLDLPICYLNVVASFKSTIEKLKQSIHLYCWAGN